MMNAQKNIEIIKANGTKQIFSEQKLLRSLRRSGASIKTAKNITDKIKNTIAQGMRTSDIYRQAFRLLRHGKTRPVAQRYNLRRAIMELGPEGSFFEKFTGEIFRALGYQEVEIGALIDGWCVQHEVDVSARKDNKHTLVECKFHNSPGYKTDLKVALYVKQRFLDIEKKHQRDNPTEGFCYEGWLMTNTKLSTQAIKFSNCAGLKVVGWGYPKIGNLEDLILQTKIQPITVLTTISARHKQQLLLKDIVLCRDIFNNQKILREIGIQNEKINIVLQEIQDIYKLNK